MPHSGASVVICTLNRSRLLLQTLKDLCGQTYRPLEIVVVDQSEEVSPEVQAFVKNHPEQVRYFSVSFRSLPQARNFGWKQARYPHVIYVDDDVRIPKNFVTEHMGTFGKYGCAIVAGGVDQKGMPLLDPSQVGKFSFWRALPLQGFGSTEQREVDHAVGCNFSCSLIWIEKVGGFDERFGKGAALYEEADFCLRVKRAGGSIRFNGQARLEHLAEPTGGCRVEKVHDYVGALARNRSLLIFEHLAFFYWPTAFAQLFKTVLSYGIAYKRPLVVFSALKGIWQSLRLQRRQFVRREANPQRGAA